MFETDRRSHPSFWSVGPRLSLGRLLDLTEDLNIPLPSLKQQAALALSGCPHFLHWRLRRLNKAYRKAVSELWEQRSEALAEFQPFAKDSPPDVGETFDQWQQRHHNLRLEYLKVGPEARWDIEDVQGGHSPPIPFEVRFPLPGLLDFLPKLPRRRGRIPDWRLYLLVYEMALSNVTDTTIADALLGGKKQPLDKDERMVRLAKIKKEMGPLVDAAFTPPA